VRFEIDSEPRGATVTKAGRALGVTPFTLTLPRTSANPVQLELAYALDGYEPESIVAQGLDGVVTVSRTLNRRAEPTPVKRPKPPKGTPKQPRDHPPGYKDDPY
jgi:hypothetical protein